MKKTLFIFSAALLILATACNSGINDKMTVKEFEKYVKDNPNDSIEEAGECYYKTLKEGTKLPSDLNPEKLYSEYDVKVTTLTGEEICKKHIVGHGDTYMPKPLPTDLYKALGAEKMNEGKEVEIYMSQDDAKSYGLLDGKCDYPMVKVNFKKTNIMREFTVYVADKEVKIKLGDELTEFLKTTATAIGNNKNILVGPGIQMHKNKTDDRYVVFFIDQKRGCCVNLVFNGEPLEWVSFYRTENGIAKMVLPDVDLNKSNTQPEENAYMVPTSLDEYKML